MFLCTTQPLCIMTRNRLWIRSLDHPACSQSLYRLSYPARVCVCVDTLLNESVPNTWCLRTSKFGTAPLVEWFPTFRDNVVVMDISVLQYETVRLPAVPGINHAATCCHTPQERRRQLHRCESHGLMPANTKPKNAKQFPAKVNPIDTSKVYYHHNNFYSNSFQVVVCNTIPFQ